VPLLQSQTCLPALTAHGKSTRRKLEIQGTLIHGSTRTGVRSARAQDIHKAYHSNQGGDPRRAMLGDVKRLSLALD